jgi:hypothetical protein
MPLEYRAVHDPERDRNVPKHLGQARRAPRNLAELRSED